jgi:hypothetical protein
MGYHLNIKFISRGKGQSLVAKGAYDARAKFREERTGELKDYSYKADAPVKSFVFVDKKHTELQDNEKLLNAIDVSEIDANAQTGLSLIAALPMLLSDEDRARIVRDFGREEFLRQNIPAVAHIHGPHEHTHNPEHTEEEELTNNGNHHVHFKIGLRTLGPDGQFGDKYLQWGDYREFLEHKRERMAELGARYLEKAQYLDKEIREREAERWRYGHLRQEAQYQKAVERGDREWAAKKAQEPGKHRGPNADALERKGIETDLGNVSREIQQRNEDRAELRALKRDLAKLERQDAFENLRQELTESRKVLAETRRADHEYANRDPAREQIAWEDNLAKAAIEKEKQQRQFVEKPANDRQQEPARPRFGDQLITRAAETAMRDTQHGETLSSPAAFRDALENHRLALARVTPEEAYKSHRESKFANAVERTAPVYQAGEIVIMREPRNDGNGNTGGRVHKLDQTKAEDYLRCLALDKSRLQGIEATKATLDDRAQTRQRAIDAARLHKDRSRGRSPQRGGLVANQMWALQRVRDAEQQRRERDRRDYSEKQKRDSGEIDSERYRTDPEYRRHAQNAQAYKSPQEKKRDRENDVRAIMEQQDRGGR